MLQVDVPGGFIPVRLVLLNRAVPQQDPLGFGGESNGAIESRGHPVTERFGFQLVDLHRPVPWHRDLLQHQSQKELIPTPDPEAWVRGLVEITPAAALGGPPLVFAVSAICDEIMVLAIADEILCRAERGDVFFVAAILIVPPVERVLTGLSQGEGPCGYIQKRVDRRGAGGGL